MMREDGDFVLILPKERTFQYQPYWDYLEHNGEWIVYGPKEVIEGLGSKMMGLVGKDGISEAKFTRNPALKVPDGYEAGVHALIVYCDDRRSQEVRERLKKLGVEEMFWKYRRENMEEIMRSKVR